MIQLLILADALPINPLDFGINGPTALLVTLLMGAIIGAYRGWWVPKFIYDKCEARGDRAEAGLEKVTNALEALTTEVRQRREASK